MTTEALAERVQQLETRLHELEARLPAVPTEPEKRGWRAVVGIHANNPRFEEAVRLGREWRFADTLADDTPEDV